MFAGALPAYLFYYQEWPFVYGVAGAEGSLPFYQSWSLGIEEKFYLLWPALAFVVWRGRMELRRAGALVLVLALALTPLYVPGQAWRLFYPYYHILTGCLIALLLDDPAWFGRLSWLSRPACAILLAAALVTLHLTLPHTGGPLLPTTVGYVAHVVYTVLTGAFLIAVLLGSGPVQRALSWPPLVKVGKLSYGIYLIHVLAIYAAQMIARPHTGYVAVSVLALLLTYALSIAGAEVLARLVERPLIERGRRISRQILGLVPSEAEGTARCDPQGAPVLADK
jgi:peptidoglycan/LPS O-acetylase OafA/YrhL